METSVPVVQQRGMTGHKATEDETPWWEEIRIGDSDTPEERRQGVLQVVKKNAQAFSQYPSDFGKAESVYHHIHTGSSPPIKERHRPLPPAMYQPVRNMISEMKDAGVIHESHSPWAAPLVIVKKKDGSLRFCVDYRKLNAVTHKDAYPLPRIEESLTALKTATYFSTLDLTSGYWQIPMAVEDREKTAFTTPMGLFEFDRMPFGLCNAPATFQRVMEHCLGHRNFEMVLLYLDDVIIYSRSYEEHLQHLDEVFAQLTKCGLKLKPSKCHLLKPKVQYLGHIVSAEGVKPEPEKIRVVRDWPVPRTVKDVRSFLGFVGYYRRFIENFAKVATPLNELLRGKSGQEQRSASRVKWTEAQQTSFDQLKASLIEAPLLAYPDYGRPFKLYTDASHRGLGAVLSQEQDGRERVIAYASRGLKTTERNCENYSAFKLELLALVWAVTEKFKNYLAATPFEIVTDNNPLAHLSTARLPALEQRWMSRLAGFRYTVVYRSGKSNGNADALSRLPTDDIAEEEKDWSEDVETPTFKPQRRRYCIVTSDPVAATSDASPDSLPCDNLGFDWVKVQRESPVMQELMGHLCRKSQLTQTQRAVADPELVKLLRHRDRLSIKHGLLVRTSTDPSTNQTIVQTVVPRQQAHFLLTAYHNQSGHFGTQKTEATLRRRYFWVGMREDIGQWCRDCVACNLKRRPEASQKDPLHPIKSHRPLELVALDHVKLEPSPSGYQYALTMTDYYSKFLVVAPVRDLTAKTTAEVFLKNFARPYGYPDRILTDQGPAFESQLFQELCTLYGCRKLRTTAYHPQCNGLCERANQTVINMLRSLSAEKRSQWPTLLPELAYLYNNTEHCSTGFTPYYLMFGRQGKLPKDLELTPVVTEPMIPQNDWVREHQHRIESAREIVNQRMEAAHHRQEMGYNSNIHATPLQLGDCVWKKKNHRSSKLDAMWEDTPYIVVGVPTDGLYAYRIQKVKEGPISTVPRDQIKRCSTKVCESKREDVPVAEECGPSMGAPLHDPIELLLFMCGSVPSGPSWVITLEQPVPRPVDNPSGPSHAVEQSFSDVPDPAVRRSERSTQGVLPLRTAKDKILSDLFIKGARGEATRAQLKLWKGQNVGCTFAKFKETMMDALGGDRVRPGGDFSSNCLTDEEHEDVPQPIRCIPQTTKGTVTQQSRSALAQDEGLVNALAEIRQEFQRHWDESEIVTPPNTWLQLLASNGEQIKFCGYWEANLMIGKASLKQQGCLVTTANSGHLPPIILGMNVLKNCPDELVEALRFEMRSAAPQERKTLQQTVRLLEGQKRFVNARGEVGKARVADHRPVILLPNSEHVVWCKARIGPGGQDYEAMIESCDTDGQQQFAVARTLAKVEHGRVPVRVLNPHSFPIQLFKHCPVAKVIQVDFQDVMETSVPVVQQRGMTGHKATEDETPWWEEIRIGDSDTPEERRQGVLQVVKKNAQAFSQYPSDFGKAESVYHHIHTGSSPPIKERHRPLPPAMYQPVRNMISEMKDAGVIHESHSPWAAPLVIVKKKDGSLRFCVDYRKLNAVTHKDAYPLPRIEESLTALKTATYFSTLDLTSGYWQIPMAVEDREKTAFTMPMGLFEFDRMPFGLCNAPATFQRVMEHCLGHRNFEMVLLYLDDVIIYSRSYEEHLQHLDEVFAQLTKCGLKLKPSKCHLLKPKVQYLGHIVSAEGVKPEPEKIRVVRDWPVPRTVKDVRSFLGFVGYYRRFIENFAKVATPLNELLRGKSGQEQRSASRVKWTEAQQTSFDQLKASLIEAPLLAYPDYGRPFKLYTDASHRGLGAVLSQEQDGRERVIAYASRGLKTTERNCENYSAFKLELLALVWAVTEKFKNYLAATPFEIVTDNNPLAHLSTARLPALEQRWMSRLAGFRYTVVYRSGKSNGNADALSRLPTDDIAEEEKDWSEDVETPTFKPQRRRYCIVTSDPVAATSDASPDSLPCDNLGFDWVKVQHESPVMQELMGHLCRKSQLTQTQRAVADPELVKLLRHRDRLSIKHGLLVRTSTDPSTNQTIVQTVVPRQQAHFLLTAYHNQSGHFGTQKTEATLRRRYFWVGMREDIGQWCRDCVACNLKRRPEASQKDPLHPIKSHRPLELVALDHVKLEPSPSGYQYALTMTDYYSKFLVVAPVRDLTAKTTAEVFLKNFARPYGYPDRILTDQGPAFESQLFQELCTLYGCRKLRTTAYHPQCNGLCERANQTVINMLRSLSAEKRSQWPTLLPELAYLYNNTEHCSTGFTPYYLMFGRQGKLPKDLELTPVVTEPMIPQNDWVREHQHRIESAREIVNQRMEAAHHRQEMGYNSNIHATPLQLGDCVWKKKNHRSSKLDAMWEDTPYIVVGVPTDGLYAYRIQKGKEGPISTVPRDQIKRCSTKVCESKREDVPVAEECGPSMGAPLHDPIELLLFMCGSVPSGPSGVITLEQPVPRPVDNPSGPSHAVEQSFSDVPDPAVRRSERSTQGVLPLRYRE
ncbi:uncharacterized protein LOC135028570 [Pseudophryne corroboree]|uniref:uncharacterized protein LOC135028570 n=1 Tax=Pseudophryne corroboree TaxID=495146 RepID=UPI003081A7A1